MADRMRYGQLHYQEFCTIYQPASGLLSPTIMQTLLQQSVGPMQSIFMQHTHACNGEHAHAAPALHPAPAHGAGCKDAQKWRILDIHRRLYNAQPLGMAWQHFSLARMVPSQMVPCLMKLT